jgi:hypothetical protein
MLFLSAQAAALILLADIAPTAAPRPPTTVSGVTIEAGPPPKLAASYPASGSTVPAGVLALKITFNQAMTPDGWSYARSGDAPFPDCLGKPRLLADQKTFVLLCTVRPHITYSLQINAVGDFRNANGRTARAADLSFSTGETGVTNIGDALTAAGLAQTDEPVMRWPDPDIGDKGSAAAPADP